MFNERDNIESALGLLKSVAGELAAKYEIIVVDDASSDGSGDIVEGMARNDEVIRLYRMEKNTMFGGAFAEGFRRASKDVIIYMDSDLPVSMEDIKESFSMIDGNDIVTGYSKIKKGDTPLRKIISGVYNLMVQGLFGLNIRDINSGYKIVKRDLIADADFISRSPFVDVELFLHAARKGSRIKQYGLVFQPRPGGKSYIARLPVIWATFRDMMKVKVRSGRTAKRG
jgi:glycosyltransferase involved in cell wall biosynthesis